jgi:hypothetical protein
VLAHEDWNLPGVLLIDATGLQGVCSVVRLIAEGQLGQTDGGFGEIVNPL